MQKYPELVIVGKHLREIRESKGFHECFYLVEGYCRAKSSGKFYQPTYDEMWETCKNSLKFKECIRFKEYNLDLRDETLPK